jgi:hypothetical protein
VRPRPVAEPEQRGSDLQLLIGAVPVQTARARLRSRAQFGRARKRVAQATRARRERTASARTLRSSSMALRFFSSASACAFSASESACGRRSQCADVTTDLRGSAHIEVHRGGFGGLEEQSRAVRLVRVDAVVVRGRQLTNAKRQNKGITG